MKKCQGQLFVVRIELLSQWTTDTTNLTVQRAYQQVLEAKGPFYLQCPVNGSSYVFNPDTTKWDNCERFSNALCVVCPHPHFDRNGEHMYTAIRFDSVTVRIDKLPDWAKGEHRQ